MYRSTFSWPRHWLEVSGQFHASAALPLGKSPRYPLDRRLGGPQSRSGRRGVVTILASTGTRTPTPRSFRPYPVAPPATLSRLYGNRVGNWKNKVGVYLEWQPNKMLHSVSRSPVVCNSSVNVENWTRVSTMISIQNKTISNLLKREDILNIVNKKLPTIGAFIQYRKGLRTENLLSETNNIPITSRTYTPQYPPIDGYNLIY
jgi:hypothetical protein